MEANKTKNHPKLTERGRLSPEVWEIDLSLAIPGLSDLNSKEDYNDSSDQSTKNKTEKENFFSKDKSKQTNTSSFNSQNKIKVVQKVPESNIKNLKDASRPMTQKVSNIEFENHKKQNEKLKSQCSILKNSEKKLISDNTLLVQKVKALGKENNELKHRLDKLTKIKNTVNCSPTNKRVGSCAAKASKNIKKTERMNMEVQRHNQALVSPWMKRVGSNNTLILNDYGNTSKFGRRETLDVNRSNQLIMFGNRDCDNTRNSDLINYTKSDDELSQSNCKSSANKMQNLTSKNSMLQLEPNMCRCSFECQNNLPNNNLPKCTCNKAWKARMKYANCHNQSSTWSHESFRNSHVHSNMLRDWENLEKEICSQVSNVVSSFLYNKFDSQSNHCRQKSKSEMGFIKPDEVNWSQAFAFCGDNHICNRNCYKSDQAILREIDNYSTNYQKSMSRETPHPQCKQAYSNSLVNQRSKYIPDESYIMASTPWDTMLSGFNSISKAPCRDRHCGSQTRKEFRDNNLAISSHLKSLNKLVRK